MMTSISNQIHDRGEKMIVEGNARIITLMFIEDEISLEVSRNVTKESPTGGYKIFTP